MSADAFLDAWAALALLFDEPGAVAVADALDGSSCVMSWLNLAEVQYVVAGLTGDPNAAEVVQELVSRLWRADQVGADVAAEAATIKAYHPMSLADAVAAGTAVVHGVPLLTGDPELLVADASWEWVDLRGMP